MSTVVEILRRAAENSPTAVITHRNADPDALASALLAWKAISMLGGEACVLLPEGLSRLSKILLEKVDIVIPECKDSERFVGLLVVDSSNSTQLGKYKDLLGLTRVYLVDHHSTGDIVDMAELWHVEKAPSTTQLVVLGISDLGLQMDSSTATVGLAGLVFDTRRFHSADWGAFIAASKLLEWGGDYGVVVKALSPPRDVDVSERMAKLKALSRLRLGRACGELLIGVTHIGAFESRVAKTIIDIGADIGIVLSRHDNELRVSVRVSERALKWGVKASELASYIADRLGGRGGGHGTVALVHIEDYSGEVEELADSISRSINGKVGRICTSAKGGDGVA